MVRSLIALMVLLAVALNAPMAMAAAATPISTPMIMAAGDPPIDDCCPPADQACQVVCVVCHAITAEPPRPIALRIAFAVLAAEPSRQMVGLNPAPETPPPRL